MKRNWKELKEINNSKSSSSIDTCSSNELEMQNRLNSLKEKKVQLNSLSSPDSGSTLADSIGFQKEDAQSLKLNEAGDLSTVLSSIKHNTLPITPNGKETVKEEEEEEECELISHRVLFSYKSVFIKSIVDITEEDKVWIDTAYHIESCCEKTKVER